MQAPDDFMFNLTTSYLNYGFLCRYRHLTLLEALGRRRGGAGVPASLHGKDGATSSITSMIPASPLTPIESEALLQSEGCTPSLPQDSRTKVHAALSWWDPEGKLPHRCAELNATALLATSERSIDVAFVGNLDFDHATYANHRKELANRLADMERARPDWRIVGPAQLNGTTSSSHVVREDSRDHATSPDHLSPQQQQQQRTTRLPKAEYESLLRRSKIFVSPFGFGEWSWKDFDAVRFGAVLVKPGVSLLDLGTGGPRIYSPNVTCIEVRPDWADLEAQLAEALAEPRRLQRLQEAALREFCRNEEAVAQMGVGSAGTLDVFADLVAAALARKKINNS